MEALGPYVLIEPLGSGSLTEAWRAVRATDGPEGPFCVIKRPLPALLGERSFQTALRQMAHLAVGIRHPGLAATWDVGETAAVDPMNPGYTWVAQELVVGASLSATLNQLLPRNRDIPRAFALMVCAQTLQGLGHAHKLALPGAPPGQMVHGDVCPGSIMLAADGRVVVTDFGLARARPALALPANLHHRYRFQYMAPETARDGFLDWRADLYAVGVLLHEMLTLRRLRKGSPDEIRQMAIAGTWPQLETLGIPTDDGLNGILAKALADHPASRYQTAEEFVADLAAYAQLRKLEAGPETTRTILEHCFPQLAHQEDLARHATRTAFNVGQPALQSVTQLGLANAPASLDAPATSPKAPAGSGAGRRVTGARMDERTSVTVRAAQGLGALVVLAVAILLVLASLKGGRAPAPVASGPPPRDLNRLVGGRTVLFWSARLSQMDKALAVSRAAGRTADTAVLEQRRADLLRKAAALGLPELAQKP